MIIPNGSTDVTTYFVMRDSTNHAPKTDVTVTDIDIYYQEQGAAQSAKADLTALAAADSAHADNKGFHCGNGVYRIDWPDAAFDGGIGKRVYLIVVCTGCDTLYREVLLSPQVDVQSISGDSAAADNAESFFDGTGYAGTNNVIPTVTSITNGVTLANDAITAAKFDESTAFPLKSADTGATAVARTGADSDTLETISDEIAAVKAETAAILADTNELQTDWANGGRLDLLLDTAAGMLGSGAITWTYTVTDGTDPIDNVQVWVTSDSAGTNVLASGYTNSSGVVTFYLDASPAVYVWCQKSGYNFTNPDTETVS